MRVSFTQRRWLERSLRFGSYDIEDVGVPIIVNSFRPPLQRPRTESVSYLRHYLPATNA